jgi:hypothetical protein
MGIAVHTTNRQIDHQWLFRRWRSGFRGHADHFDHLFRADGDQIGAKRRWAFASCTTLIQVVKQISNLKENQSSSFRLLRFSPDLPMQSLRQQPGFFDVRATVPLSGHFKTGFDDLFLGDKTFNPVYRCAQLVPRPFLKCRPLTRSLKMPSSCWQLMSS